MNRILEALPEIGKEDYSNNPPRWFKYFFKFLSALVGAGMAIWTVSDWQTMPIGFRLMVCILVPSFLLFAFHPNWGLTEPPSLLANHLGMYFSPSGSLRFGQQPRKVWLFVPWENISNIRYTRIVKGEFSKGMVMDVKASSDEIDEFFGHYGKPSDRKQFEDGRISVVFYEGGSQKLVTNLLSLMKNSGLSNQSIRTSQT
jgi:hypothetical protein